MKGRNTTAIAQRDDGIKENQNRERERQRGEREGRKEERKERERKGEKAKPTEYNYVQKRREKKKG